jgi:hypothetical protein
MPASPNILINRCTRLRFIKYPKSRRWCIILRLPKKGCLVYSALSQQHDAQRIVPHPRTLRRAREQIKCMVLDGVSPLQIRNSLNRWVIWWVNASKTWQHHELLNWFIHLCWDTKALTCAISLLQMRPVKELRTASCWPPSGE